MFIKWRTYQRQEDYYKGDKYFMQPVLVKSFRASKKQFKEFAKHEGWTDQEFKDHWKQHKEHMNKPRHKQLFRFPRFASCAYVYYDSPRWIEERKNYWHMVEFVLEIGALSNMPDEIKRKIEDEIETILPKPYGYLLDILEDAYREGMQKAYSPYEEELKKSGKSVVPHHVGLQKENSNSIQ